MPRKKTKLVDIKYHAIMIETLASYGFDFGDGKDEPVWIPKSQCEVDEEDSIVTMQKWIAIEKEIEQHAI